MTKTILITGATGKQGSASINGLLESGEDIEILALTRNAQSPSAQKLKSKSSKIKIIEGNMDQPEMIFDEAKKATSNPVWGVYSVQAIFGSGQNSETEEIQGKALVDAAIRNNVKFFVYSSVERNGEVPTDVPHFISKHNVEQHLFASTANNSMSWCILRPVTFFDNLGPGFAGKLFATWWVSYLGLSEKKLQLISTTDIGVFAAKAFLRPEEYKGRKISLAGDDLTYDEARKVVKEATGEEIQTTWRLIAAVVLWMTGDLAAMFKWFETTGGGADINALKREHADLKDFRRWVETESEWAKKRK